MPHGRDLDSKYMQASNGFSVIEGNRFSDIVFIVLGFVPLALIIAAIIGIFYWHSIGDVITSGIMFVIGVFLGQRFWRHFKRRGKTLMILKAEGIELANFSNQIPWSEVKKVVIVRKTLFFIPLSWEINIFFHKTFNGKFIKSARYGSKYLQRHHQLIMMVFGIKNNLTAEELLDSVDYYQTQAKA